MWLDDIYRCKAPAETATCLLSTTGETMQLTIEVDFHRLVNLTDRLVDLMLDVEAVDAGPKPAVGGQWQLLFGGNTLYEPSVAAGLFGLSSALSAAMRDGTLDADALYLATESIDRLPERFVADGGSADGIATAFRRYAFVPTADAIRRIWIAYAFSSEEDPASATGSLARRFFRRAWRDFVDLGYEPIDRSSAVKGLVLTQLAAISEPATPTIASLDFDDLPGLAAQQNWALEEHGGPNGVATAFQARVTALMSSFSCRVVGAKSGDPLGDIYLELPNGDFILVDAKSTGAPNGYGLPQTHQDAIGRYLEDAERVLPAGRRFRAVLIVGPDPGKSLAGRLANFESLANCTIRYSSASQLLRFHAGFPGGPLVDFERVLAQSPHVLPDQWWKPLITASEEETGRLADYLRSGPRR